MNNLTRENILETYTKSQIQAELQKLNIHFQNNYPNDQLLDLFFQQTYEVQKIYTTEELDKFQVSTLYSLCKRLGITNFSAKGYIPTYQKVNFISEYSSHIRTRTQQELKELSVIKYPSNGRFVWLQFLSPLNKNEISTYELDSASIHQIIYVIKEKYRYIQSPSKTIDLIEFLYFATQDILNNILEEIGNYPYKNLTYDEKICLITWHILYKVDYVFLEDREFSLYLENTKLETLNDRIIGEYKYPPDNATKLWILNTKSIPPITKNHLGGRYEQLISYAIQNINLLSNAYNDLPTSK